MNVSLKSIHIENFKGIKAKDIEFSNRTKIKGRNGAGKTTILDAVLWLLFGKNSQYVEKFDLRPLDSDGKQINFVDIIVLAVFDIDGNETELKKTQKQNWVKHRGSEDAVFQGNVNSYEIDGYPRNDKEFKEFVAGMIDENLFKILTNPAFFPTLKWKEQRDILMNLVNSESDYEIAMRLGGFDELLGELKAAPNTEAITKKFANSKRTLEATLKELPVRIDELSKQKADVDVYALESKKAELENAIAENSKSNSTYEIDELKKQAMETDFSISTYCMESERKTKEERMTLESRISELNAKKRVETANIASAEREISLLNAHIESATARLDDLGKTYFAKRDTEFDATKWVFDENSTFCSLCGQKLPADKIEQIKADFESNKDNAKKQFETEKKNCLNELTKEGGALKDSVTADKAKVESNNGEIYKSRVALEQIDKMLENTTTALSNMPVSVDLSNDTTYLALKQKAAEIKAKIDEIQALKNSSVVVTSNLRYELNEINEKLAAASNNAKIEERITELQKEQFETAQKIADAEKMLFLVETFIRVKLEDISATINNHFKTVKFKLFDTAINGGIAETCELTVNGVPYGDLNNGHRIVAGLDISNTLSEIYGKNVFSFVDNAESINEVNIPDVKHQLICLYVTEDAELTVE